jgi:hypothetical protein
MSKNYNRAKFNKAHNNKEYRKIILKWYYPPYYEEGWTWNHGDLPNHKWREYKTWKHNRKTKYKN